MKGIQSVLQITAVVALLIVGWTGAKTHSTPRELALDVLGTELGNA